MNNPVIFKPDHSLDHLSVGEKAIEALKDKFTLLETRGDGTHVFECYRRSFERIFPVLKAMTLGKIMVECLQDNIITVKTTED